MADFLLVPDAGHGAWSWGRVWGCLTTPVENPPRLYATHSIGQVVAQDLPVKGSGAGQDGANLTIDGLVSAVIEQVASHNLRDLVLVGHGITAPVLFQAATRLETPPRRIVLFAGLIPNEGKTVLNMLPRKHRMVFNMVTKMQSAGRGAFRLPKAVIANGYCNDMDQFDVIQIVGRFGPLPLQLFNTRIYLDDFGGACPVTYVPLWRDRLIPSDLQYRMAERLGGVEILRDMDACHEVMVERPREVADILMRYA